MEAIFFLLATALATIVYTRQNAFPSDCWQFQSHHPPLEDTIDILQI